MWMIIAALLAGPPLRIGGDGVPASARPELQLRIVEAGWAVAGPACADCGALPVEVVRQADRIVVRIAGSSRAEPFGEANSPVAAIVAAQAIDGLMRARGPTGGAEAPLGLRFGPGIPLEQRAALLHGVLTEVAAVGQTGRRSVCVGRTDAGLRAWDGACGTGTLIATDVRAPEILRAALRTAPVTAGAALMADPPSSPWFAGIGVFSDGAVALSGRSGIGRAVHFTGVLRGIVASDAAALQYGAGVAVPVGRFAVGADVGAEVADVDEPWGAWAALPVAVDAGVVRLAVSPYFDTRRGGAVFFEVGLGDSR